MYLALLLLISLPAGMAAPSAAADTGLATVAMLPNDRINPIFDATVQATEEAIINALVAATDMGGTEWDRFTVRALDHAALGHVLRQYGKRAAR